MRQTRMAKGDFHISRRPSHADFNIAYSEVKVRMPNQLKTPSNKGKIKFDVSFHDRSEEHTSELQSLTNLVCRLLLEKKKKRKHIMNKYLILRQTVNISSL